MIGCQWHRKRKEKEGGLLPRGSISDTLVIPANEGRGAYEVSFAALEQSVDELYLLPQRFLEGQAIQVQEILRISVEIEDASVVDVDSRWFGGRQYIGSWRLNVDNLQPFVTEGDEGFITSQFFDIVRYSTITVIPSRGVASFISGGTRVNDCNFLLQPASSNPDFPLLIDGFGLKIKEGVFLSDNATETRLLRGGDFNARIRTCGLFLRDGCRLSQVNYIRSVINEIETDSTPTPPTTTCLTAPDTCNAPYAASITEDGLFSTFSSLSDAVAFADANDLNPPALVNSIEVAQFLCPNGTTRPYWRFNILDP